MESDISIQDRQRLDVLLRNTYQKPALSILSRLLGEDSEYNYNFDYIAPHAASSLFRQSSLFWIQVKAPFLSFPILPGGNSKGLFAISEGVAMALSAGKPESTQMLLDSEHDSPQLFAETESQDMLAELILDALFSTSRRQYELIRSFEDLETFRGPNGFAPYTLAPPTLKLKHQEPLSVNCQPLPADSGFSLRFHALAGWMHEKNELLEILLEYEKGKPIRLSERLILRPVFSQIPVIRY